jgi:hypothetical protein
LLSENGTFWVLIQRVIRYSRQTLSSRHTEQAVHASRRWKARNMNRQQRKET